MEIPKAKRIEIKKANEIGKVYVSIISKRKIDINKIEDTGLVKLKNIDNVIKITEFRWSSRGGGKVGHDPRSNRLSGYASNIEYVKKENLPQELI